jgi:hypothetical protein
MPKYTVIFQQEARKMRLHTFVVTVLLMLPALTAYADVNMKPGMWEQTTKVEMQGMQMPMQETTVSYCLRKEDLVPQDKNQSGCKVFNVKTRGNTVTWQVQCDNNGVKSSGSGTVTYNGTTSKGNMKITVNNPGMGPMTMHQDFTARRIGECR